jgi:protein arginine kinase activator
MTCEICKRNAATFYRHVPNLGRQVPICSACSSKLSGTGVSTSSSLGGMFTAFNEMVQKTLSTMQPNSQFVDYFSNAERIGSVSVICPNCGSEFSRYHDIGRFGCSKCYDIFHEQIARVARKIHGTAQHNGSRPTERKGGAGQ